MTPSGAADDPVLALDANDIYGWPTTVRLLRVLLFGALVASSLYLAVLLFAAPNQVPRIAGTVAAMLIAASSLALVALGRTKAAAYLLVFGFWGLTSAVVVFIGGVRTPMVIAFPLIIFLAGWLVGKRTAVAIAVVSVAYVLALAAAESLGYAAWPATPPLLHGIIQSAVFLLSAIAIAYAMNIFRGRVSDVAALSGELARAKAEALHAERMKRNERLLARMGETARVGGWELDFASGDVRWTAETYRIHDMSPDRKVDLATVLASYAPEDRLRIEAAVAGGRLGRAFDLELPKTTATGRSIWVHTIGEPVWEGERVVGLFGSVQDVTALKRTEFALRESEQRFRDFSESTSDWLWETDRDMRFSYISETAANVLGADPKRLIGMSRAELLERDKLNPPELIADHLAALAARQAFRDLEYRMLDARGKEMWVSVSGRPVFDGDGRFTGYRGSGRVVTERKDEQARLAAALDVAERASRAKSEFLASMSHELRTPLNSILGFSQLLGIDKELPVGARDNAAEIERAGRHLLALVEELIDLARIDSGRVELAAEPVNIGAVVADSLSMVRPIAASMAVDLSDDLGAVADGMVVADYVRLRQVLINLLSNALKYNHRAGWVRVTAKWRDDGCVRILVADSGRGIPAEKHGRVFVAFDRLGEECGTVEGSGIGLVITQRLVISMGGKIGFDSMEGQGSTFWVEFPVTTADAGDGSNAADRPPAFAIAEPKVLDVLYIEDNAMNRSLMRHVFAVRPDCRLREANSAEAGIEAAYAAPPSLILLDLNLPGMDGYTALRALQADPRTRGIPVVAVTANAMIGDRERGLAAGFADYLTKPIDIAALYRLLDQLAAGTSVQKNE